MQSTNKMIDVVVIMHRQVLRVDDVRVSEIPEETVEVMKLVL